MSLLTCCSDSLGELGVAVCLFVCLRNRLTTLNLLNR
jgi:hypothetical protein